MVWKIVNNSDAGDADHMGGNDADKVSQLFSGIDVDDVDINSDWRFYDDKCKFWNPANTFSYNVSTNAIIANRTITLPLLAANDTFTFNNLSQTLAAKTLDSSCIISSAGSLPSTVVTEDVSNSFDDLDQSFKDNRLRIWNPADTFRYTLVAGAIAANRTLNLPLITGTDTLASLGLAQTFTAAQTFNNSLLKLRNPGDTFSYTVVPAAIVADRNLTLPLLTGNDTAVTEAHTQTLTNKTIEGGGYNYGDTTGNVLRGSGVDNPWAGAGSSASVKRTGLYCAVGSTQAEGYVGGTFTAIGTNSSNKSTAEGFGQDYATTAVANANAGLRQGATRWRREWGMYCKGRIKLSSTSDIRLFIGWSSDTAEIAGETTLNNFSGVGIGKRAGDTNLFTMVNDGDATEDRVDTTIAASTSAFTFELQLNATNFQSKIGGVEQTPQTTEIPASATDLAFHCEIETGAGAADKTLTILPIFFKVGS